MIGPHYFIVSFTLLSLIGYIIAEYTDFITWFTHNGGIVHEKISITNYDNMGNGMIALDNINELDEILRIPLKLCLSYESLKVSYDPLHIYISNSFSSSNNELAVTLVLLVEKMRGKDSFFYPYLQLLPTYIPNLSYFNDEELLEFQQSDLIISAKSYQKSLKKKYDDLYKVASKILPHGLFQKMNYDLYLWASSIIDSRGLRFRGKVYLVPFADLMNYNPHPTIRSQKSGELFLKYHILKGDEVSILSDRNHVKGEQIYEDYGDNLDSIYITHHGFIPNVNPFRCIKIVAPAMLNLAENTLEFVKSLRFQGPPGKCVDSSYDIGQGVLVYFTALSMDSDEISSCIKKTNLTQPNWSFIFESCGFNKVQQFLHDLTIRNIDDTINFPTNIEKYPLPSYDLLLDDTQYEEILNDSSSLEKRMLMSLRKWLEIIYPTYSTSLEDDIEFYKSLESQYNISHTNHSHTHKMLAIKYRIHQKLAWANLCTVYGANCHIWSLELDPTSSSSNNNNNNNNKSIRKTKKSQESEELPPVGPDLVSDDIDPNALTMSEKLIRFNHWFQAAVETNTSNQLVNLLEAVEIDGYRIGTIATKDISAEQVYLQVPQSIILDHEKAMKSPVGELLDALNKKFGRADEYQEMIFFLLHQRFVEGIQSDFWPYLSLLPLSKDLVDLPLFWLSEDVESRVHPSFLMNPITQYRDRIVKMFEFVVNLEEVVKFFPKHVLTFDNYRWASTMLDSRSIWWNGKRHLVPMLDFVNCKEHVTNTSRVHKTEFNSHLKVAETNAGASFLKGEQVFENYGQPNYIYFQFHGFTLVSSDGKNENTHDCVHFEFSITQTEGEAIDTSSPAAKKLIEQLHLRSKAAISECLKYPISTDVWLFLALKMNKFEKLEARGELGKPTATAVKLLIDLIEERLPAYEEFDTSYTMNRHYESKRFISSEGQLLQSIHQRLIEDYERLSQNEFIIIPGNITSEEIHDEF